MRSPLHFLRQAFAPRRRAVATWMIAATLATAGAALVPALAGLLLSSKGAPWAIGTALLGAGILAARGFIRQQLSHLGRVRMLAHIGHVVATRSALSTASHGADRIEAKLFGSSYATSRLLSEHAPTLLGNVLALLIVAPAVVWLTTWELALIALPTLTVLGLAVFFLRRALTRKLNGANDAAMAMVDESSSLLRGHLELAASARLLHQAGRMADRALAYSEALRRAERAGAIGGRVPMLAAGSLALLFGWLWIGDRPDLLASGLVKLLVLGSVLPMVSGIARSFGEANRSLREIAPVVDLLDVPAAPQSKANAVTLQPNEAIRFHNVSFSYGTSTQDESNTNAPAIRSVSLTWRPGELLAITGPNGAGKSTLVRLLLRLADPDEGAVYIGATDLREGDLDTWKRSIAYLPQRPYLPEGFTLRALLNTFGPDGPEDRMLDALASVDLLPKLQREHPNDPLEAKAATLSAGQRQRFALARVLADPAPVLVLDEPDANLDAAGLDRLISSLPRLSDKRRVLLVAHDRRLLACADRIVQLGLKGESFDATASSQ